MRLLPTKPSEVNQWQSHLFMFLGGLLASLKALGGSAKK
jgi:hypothetical protein